MKRFLRNAGIFSALAFCSLAAGTLFSGSAFAATGYVISGPSSVNTGQSFDLTYAISSDENIKAVGAIVAEPANGCFTINSMTPIGPARVTLSKRKVSWGSTPATTVQLVTVNFKASDTACSGTTSITSNGSTDTITTASGKVSYEVSGSHTVSVAAPAPKSSDADLTNLTVSAGTLDPGFSSGTTSYNVTVGNGVTSITLTPTKSDPKASASSKTCTLNVGANTCSVVVTAEDGTKKTYTVNVLREGPTPGGDENPGDDKPGDDKPGDDKPGDDKPGDDKPSDKPVAAPDALLKNISADGKTISGFNPQNTTYTINVSNGITGMTFTAVPNTEGTTYRVEGDSGWKVGTNTVKVIATSANGEQRTYVINVVRAKAPGSTNTGEKEKGDAKSNNNYLSTLVSHDGALSPNFDKDVTTYSVRVPKDVTKLDLTALPESSKAKVEITGNSNFEIGKTNVVTITVTAEDGTKRIYTINVTREDTEAKTDLSTLSTPDGTLSPAFNPNTTKYTVKVPYDKDEIDISAIAADPESTVEIIGNKNLKVGKNTVLVKVTDKNGFTKVYEIEVTREGEPTFLGIRRSVWWAILGGAGLLLLFLFLLWLLLRRRRYVEEDDLVVAPNTSTNSAPVMNTTPTIEFNPAFNFGSRVGTDDDTVMPYGTNAQIAEGASAAAKPLLEASAPLLRTATRAQNTEGDLATANAASMTGLASEASIDEIERRAELRAEQRILEREAERRAEERLARRRVMENNAREAEFENLARADEAREDALEMSERASRSARSARVNRASAARAARVTRDVEDVDAARTARTTRAPRAQDEFWN